MKEDGLCNYKVVKLIFIANEGGIKKRLRIVDLTFFESKDDVGMKGPYKCLA